MNKLISEICEENLQQASSLDTHGVLVDGNNHFVLQYGPRTVGQVSKIIRHDKRCSHDGPQSHLRASLVHTETEVPNDELGRDE